VVTTIQLNENVKNELDRLKCGKRTYEEVIVELIQETERNVRSREELLIEGCRAMAKEDLTVAKEWESADGVLGWEW